MRRLVHLDAAMRDPLAIHDHFAEVSQSAAVARAFTEELRQQNRRLATLPGTIGRARPALLPGIRSFPIRGHIIFFRHQDGALLVINVRTGIAISTRGSTVARPLPLPVQLLAAQGSAWKSKPVSSVGFTTWK